MRTIRGINTEEEVVVRKEWLSGLLSLSKFVEAKPSELSVLIGYISSVDVVIKAGELSPVKSLKGALKGIKITTLK